MIRPLLKSILKYVKDDSEIRFFSSLIETNAETAEIVAINKGIHILRKNFLDFTSKGDHNFKKVKIRVADLIKYLCQILKGKCKNYDDLGGLPIQTRIRDYIIEIQSSQSMEINGIEFLEIISREARLISAETKSSKQAVAKRQQQAAQSPRPLESNYTSTPVKGGNQNLLTGDSGGSQSPAPVSQKVKLGQVSLSPRSPLSGIQEPQAKPQTVSLA